MRFSDYGWAQTFILVFASLLIAFAAVGKERPNILFCISDDQSYPHMSAYGEPVIQTPVFDRFAREGVLFTQAYYAAPSCTPSRSAIATGPGAQLFGTLPVEQPTYTDLLADAGYAVGYTRKGWGPGRVGEGGHRVPLIMHIPSGRYGMRSGDWVYIDHSTGRHYTEPGWFRGMRGVQPHNEPGELYNLNKDPQQKRTPTAKHPRGSANCQTC